RAPVPVQALPGRVRGQGRRQLQRPLARRAEGARLQGIRPLGGELLMRRVASVLVIVAAAVGVTVLTGASNNPTATGKTYNIQFDNAFGLTTGGDLKVGGVRAGQTSGFGLKKIANGRYVAVVKGNVSESGIAAFHKDASCEIRPQSLIGEYYVDCQPGSAQQM